MNLISKNLKARLLSLFYALAVFLTTSPLVLAAEKEEEAKASEPVWVLSWASFILFCGLTVAICVFFSRRRETLLTNEEQKQVAALAAERLAERRKAERLARMQAGQKKSNAH
ncbi:MAG: hypothetical protein IJE97_17565 [Thermoguttaceae bacterium]|nr:hypothetical protein [Thermoguttaceae bacterium]